MAVDVITCFYVIMYNVHHWKFPSHLKLTGIQLSKGLNFANQLSPKLEAFNRK